MTPQEKQGEQFEQAVEAALIQHGDRVWGRGWRLLDAAPEKVTREREEQARAEIRADLQAALPYLQPAEGDDLREVLRVELTHGGIADEVAQVIVVLDNENKRVAATRLQRALDVFRARIDATLSQHPDPQPDYQYEHHMEQCAHGGTLMQLDRAKERITELEAGPMAQGPQEGRLREAIEGEVKYQRSIEQIAGQESMHLGSMGDFEGEKEAKLVAVTAGNTLRGLEAALTADADALSRHPDPQPEEEK